MQTFLIASNNPVFIDSEIKQLTKNLNVSTFNLIEIVAENTISIADVRMISQTMTLKPYGGGERVIILRNIDKATLEASNALLKILEEPPPGNYLILVCENINKLLPTIVSRCQIITENKTEKTQHDSDKTKKILQQILISSPGERILLSQKLANSREEAIRLLENFLITLEEVLHKPDEKINLKRKEIAILLTKINTAKNYLERYINFKATLDILFLGFPKITQ